MENRGCAESLHIAIVILQHEIKTQHSYEEDKPHF